MENWLGHFFVWQYIAFLPRDIGKELQKNKVNFLPEAELNKPE